MLVVSNRCMALLLLLRFSKYYKYFSVAQCYPQHNVRQSISAYRNVSINKLQ